jgi:hypothetical protein
VRPELANRAVNLLCCLGLLAKVQGSGGIKGDRLTLGSVDVEEAKRRFGALFPDGNLDLRAFKRELVAATLGGEIAAAVFRRGAAEAARPCHGDGTPEVLRRYSKDIAEVSEYLSEADVPPLSLPKSPQNNPFVAAIREAEAAGDWARTETLLRGLVAWAKAGRPPDMVFVAIENGTGMAT